MIVANKGQGGVMLIHGNDKTVDTVQFTPWGSRDSVRELDDDEWAKSRNLKRYLKDGTLHELDDLVEFPSPPETYQALRPWQRARVRAIVLGSEEEFERNGLFTPMGNAPNAAERVDDRYIRSNLTPVLTVSTEWLKLIEAVDRGNKRWSQRQRKIREHERVLKDLLTT